MIAPAEKLYLLGALLIVVGIVIQDVVADAMSTEVVSRVDEAGNARPEHDIRAELGMVQVLGRLALSFGILAVAGLSGWLAGLLDRPTVFLLGLFVPALSVIGAMLIKSERTERRPPDVRILGGGIAFGAIVIIVAAGGVPFAQELIFAFSLAVICTMLVLVTKELDTGSRRAILFASLIIFAFRATPSVGDGYFWWTLDVLKFDEAFYGTLRQTAAILGLVALWAFSKQLTEYPVAKVLLWLVIAGSVLSLPNIGLFYGLHNWTEATFGFGARTIAMVDAATASPFAQLSMVPLLTLIAFYAPQGHRATWFALMASFMNLALVAGQLQTKYLNQLFVIERGRVRRAGRASDRRGVTRVVHPPRCHRVVWPTRLSVLLGNRTDDGQARHCSATFRAGSRFDRRHGKATVELAAPRERPPVIKEDLQRPPVRHPPEDQKTLFCQPLDRALGQEAGGKMRADQAEHQDRQADREG